MVRALLILATAMSAVLASVSAASQAADQPGGIAASVRAVPVAARLNYSVHAAIRPLPLVWLGRDNIGTGQFTRRRGSDGHLAFELLVGSDPAKAPRSINRWGYLGEELHGNGGSIVSVIKQSDEQTLADTTAAMQRHAAQQRFPFRVYAGLLNAGQVRAGSTTFHSAEDFTQGGFERLFGLVAGISVPLSGSAIAPGTRTGLLSTITELLNESATAWRTQVPDPIKGRRVPYFFNGQTYLLHVSATDLRRAVSIGGRRFENVVRARAEGIQPGTDKSMAFELWYPVSGPLAGAPIRVLAQPRWWFRFELTLSSASGPS